MAQPRPKLDWWTILLLALLLAMPGYAIASADWAPGLEMLQPTSLAGLLIGVVIARSAFRRLPAQLLGLGYGAAWIAFNAIGYLPRAAGSVELGEKLIALGRHVGEWVWVLINTGVGKDNFMFLLAMMVVFWLLGFVAAWHTFRVTRALRVVLLPGMVILVNLYYYGGHRELAPFLYLYFACALLYLARIHFTLREREWQQARVGYDGDVRRSFLRGGSIVTVFAVFIAWAGPEVAAMPQFDDLWRGVSRPIQSIEDAFNRLFSGLEGEGPALTNAFGKTLGFAGPRHLGDTVLMDVLVHKSEDNAYALARYWRAGTYDIYTSNGWIRSNADESFNFGPDIAQTPTLFKDRANVQQTFTFYYPRTSLLIAAAQPIYFSRAAEADDAQVTDAVGRPVIDPSFVRSLDVVRAGDHYDAVSALSIADVDSLRAAGSAYPSWIADRYLRLPDSFPQRVKDLARQIVAEAGAINPFDQATALELWLRRNITYDDQIPGPRQGQDGVDYVLFEVRAGYCDYYAGAMVTMARSLGIPARVAVGYARGVYEPSGDVYRVREHDAHAWVEVYFPEYGWIEFEPTAAQPLISRPIRTEVDNPESPIDIPTAPDVEPLDRLSRLGEDEGITPPPSEVFPILLARALPAGLLALAGLLIVGAVLAAGMIYVVENRGLRHLRGAGWAYARLRRLAAWLRVELHPHHTPYEQATLLDDAAPDSRQAIDLIADDYVRETFGRDGSGADRAQSAWRQIHLRLWWAGLKRRVRNAIRRPHLNLSNLRFLNRRK
jgi:transglutaminase-like putative cysteine protease